MIQFHYNPSPNPAKVALFLEEAGLPYELVPVDPRKGEQHSAAFRAINPNAKTPAIVDGDATVFDSNAILLYLAEKTGRFLPDDTPAARGEMLSWLMFVATGIGPYAGQAVHFKHHAPEPNAYAINRYDFEAWRHWRIVDERLATSRYMLGDTYTLVDMAVWGWARGAVRARRNRLGTVAAREAPARRNQCAAGRAARRSAEGAPRVQDRDGRRGPPRDVPAERAARGRRSNRSVTCSTSTTGRRPTGTR